MPVRTHPVTGEKILWAIGGHGKRIAGYKIEESDNTLNFLKQTLIGAGDIQIRAHHKPGTVTVWDKSVAVYGRCRVH